MTLSTDTQDWSLHVDDREADSQLITVTPEVHCVLFFVFQQVAGCGVECRSWAAQQLGVCETVTPTHVLSCSCVHQKLDKLVHSQPRVVGICDKCAEPPRVRMFFHQS